MGSDSPVDGLVLLLRAGAKHVERVDEGDIILLKDTEEILLLE